MHENLLRDRQIRLIVHTDCIHVGHFSHVGHFIKLAQSYAILSLFRGRDVSFFVLLRRISNNRFCTRLCIQFICVNACKPLQNSETLSHVGNITTKYSLTYVSFSMTVYRKRGGIFIAYLCIQYHFLLAPSSDPTLF